MPSPSALLLATAFANHVALAHFAGRQEMGDGGRWLGEARAMLGLVNALAMIPCAMTAWGANRMLAGSAFEFLRLPALVLAAAISLAALHVVAARALPALHGAWRRQGLLVAANSAVLAWGVLSAGAEQDFSSALLMGVLGAAAFALLLGVFGGLRERLAQEVIPRAMRGVPIELVTAALVTLACLGLAGLERHA